MIIVLDTSIRLEIVREELTYRERSGRESKETYISYIRELIFQSIPQRLHRAGYIENSLSGARLMHRNIQLNEHTYIYIHTRDNSRLHRSACEYR